MRHSWRHLPIRTVKNNISKRFSLSCIVKFQDMKCILLTLFCLITLSMANAQVGIGTTTPVSSAILELNSSDKGFLPPRMSAANRIALPSPANGLLVFDNDSATLFLYQQTGGWRKMTPVSNLGSIVAGTSAGDVLVWNGTAWVVTPKCNLFNFYFRDKDGDGKGDKYSPLMACAPIAGFVADSLDCDDNNPLIGQTKQYRDADNDGYGDNNVFIFSCAPQPGYVSNNTDCDDTNSAISPATADLPDDGFADTDCDGIDGKESVAIFVSPSGNDANAGTKALPVKTIGVGITKAAASAKSQILVAGGTYNETVTMQSGISIYGGYNSTTWARASANVATIIGQTTAPFCAINASGVTNATIDRFTITGPNATGATSAISNSSYGIYSASISTATIKNCTITAGNGAAGVAGSAGPVGGSGGSGSQGINGNCDNNSGGSSGIGGSSSCSRDGGFGGVGGYSGPGGTGAPGIGGSAGGSGGFFGNPGGNGAAGVFGLAGANGTSGTGGAPAIGSTVSNIWSGTSGGVGGTAAAGNGGGGGGGGGGQNIAFTGGRGNGGSGGGGGGCLGTSGSGGTAGGGAIAIYFASHGSGVYITNNILITGAGGGGGIGGTGGAGGTGGLGGSPVFFCTGEIGAGGAGGAGGTGGAGAGGGGGAGGISYGIYTSTVGVTYLGNSFTIGTPGMGGSGGASTGNPGSAGVTGAGGNTFP